MSYCLTVHAGIRVQFIIRDTCHSPQITTRHTCTLKLHFLFFLFLCYAVFLHPISPGLHVVISYNLRQPVRTSSTWSFLVLSHKRTRPFFANSRGTEVHRGIRDREDRHRPNLHPPHKRYGRAIAIIAKKRRSEISSHHERTYATTTYTPRTLLRTDKEDQKSQQQLSPIPPRCRHTSSANHSPAGQRPRRH